MLLSDCYSEGRSHPLITSAGHWIPIAHSRPKPAYGLLSCPLELSKYVCQSATSQCIESHQYEFTSCRSYPFHPVMFLKALENKLVVLIGDSLTRQHLISLVCRLHPHASPPMSEQPIPWRNPEKSCVNTEHCDIPDEVCFTFRFNVTICRGKEQLLNIADVVVYNGGGIHFHHDFNVNTLTDSQKGENETLYEEKLLDIVSLIESFEYYPYGRRKRLLIYRETSGQGFEGPTGDFDVRSLPTRTGCRPRPYYDNHPNGTVGGVSVYGDFYSGVRVAWRQVLERNIVERAGIPYFATLKMSATLPCDGLGFVGSRTNKYDFSIEKLGVRNDCTYVLVVLSVTFAFDALFLIISSCMCLGTSAYPE